MDSWIGPPMLSGRQGTDVPALLLVALLVVPLLELYVILQVADVIGGWQTLVVLVAESVLGTWLVRREGRRTWRAFSRALEEARPPAREVADGALVIVGGTLLLTPGFLSDVLGFFVLLPVTRPIARRLLLRWGARRMGGAAGGFAGAMFGLPRMGRTAAGGRSRGDVADGGSSSGEVIDGEVLGERVERPPGEA
ncbi:MAG: protein FxsA [Frankiaceae bacterium]|nr:protein FxsA [Frankiaceae bacterium]